MNDGEVAHEVEQGHGLTHAGAARKDHQVARDGAQHGLEVLPRHGQARVLSCGLIVFPALDQLLHRRVPPGGVLARVEGGLERQQPGRGGLDHLFGVRVLGVAHRSHLRTGLDRLPQLPLVADDLGVVRGVRRRRHALDQGVQVGRAADLRDFATAGEFLPQRDRVDRLALAVHVDDGAVDRLVGGLVELVALEDLHDLGDGVLGQLHPAEDGLLGVLVLRRDPLKVGGRRPEGVGSIAVAVLRRQHRGIALEEVAFAGRCPGCHAVHQVSSLRGLGSARRPVS